MINSKLLNLIFDFNNQAQSLITKIPTLSGKQPSTHQKISNNMDF